MNHSSKYNKSEDIFYAGERDIISQKFYRYGRDNLFRKSSVVKECETEKQISYKFFQKLEKAKK